MMKQEKQLYLNLRRLPARLTAEQVAWELGFEIHEIPILIKERLLKPLGRPASNSPKYFATCAIVAVRDDVTWFDKACKAISRRWREKNGRNTASFAN